MINVSLLASFRLGGVGWCGGKVGIGGWRGVWFVVFCTGNNWKIMTGWLAVWPNWSDLSMDAVSLKGRIFFFLRRGANEWHCLNSTIINKGRKVHFVVCFFVVVIFIFVSW